MTLLGSGNVLAQLAENGLIDAYHIMIDPIVLGKERHYLAELSCHQGSLPILAFLKAALFCFIMNQFESKI